MRLFSHRGTSLLLLVAAATPVVCCGARADELFVMPYSCRVAGGHLVLTPSDDQGHPVIGRREQQDFRACSPVNPRLCRRWTVHRFDLDCGGARVPWVDVAAAADVFRDGRSYVQGGRLELEMPARWSLPPDAPCARMEASEDGERFGGMRRYCAERLETVRRVTVAMPRGFAPMLGVDGIFVADKSRPAMSDASMSRSVPREPDAKVAPAKPAPAKSAPAKPPVQSEPPIKPSETTTASLQTAPAPIPAPKPPKADVPAAESSGATGAAPVIPQIINGKNSSQAGAESEAIAASPPPPEPEPAPATPPPREAAQAAEPSQVPTAKEPPDGPVIELPPSANEVDSIPVTPVAATGDPVDATTKTIAVGGLAALALLTLAIALRRRRGQSAVGLSRDIAAVSFDKKAPQEEGVPTLSALPVVTTAPEGQHLGPSLSMPLAPFGDTIPRTREEAMRVLGMGIAPDLNEAAIKKIIDGLRLSWHPDHASSPADRATRELRLKQINVAWDIIAGQRAG